MNDHSLPTRQKALTLNLDAKNYGTFAEIGGGQEVSRWFFSVGGAAGTVAETVSAYDKAVSDRLYGHATRYVSRERLRAMLEQEFNKLREGLDASQQSVSSHLPTRLPPAVFRLGVKDAAGLASASKPDLVRNHRRSLFMPIC